MADLEASGTLKIVPDKGPARATDGDWKEPNTHPLEQAKADGSSGSVSNVGKDAGKMSGQKGGRTKVW